MQKRSCCATGSPIRRWPIRATARGIDLARLKQFNDIAAGGVRPNLTFLLDCPIALGLARTGERQVRAGQPREDRFEREKREFHEKVRSGFLELAAAEPKRFRVIDASRSVDEVTLDIRKIIDRDLA